MPGRDFQRGEGGSAAIVRAKVATELEVEIIVGEVYNAARQKSSRVCCLREHLGNIGFVEESPEVFERVAPALFMGALAFARQQADLGEAHESSIPLI